MTGLLYMINEVTDRRADAARLNWETRPQSGVRQEILLDVVAVGLEQHARAAKLTNLLLGSLDHAVAFAGVGGHHFAGASHLEALFSARLRLQLGHLALLCRNTKPPVKAFGRLKCSLER